MKKLTEGKSQGAKRRHDNSGAPSDCPPPPSPMVKGGFESTAVPGAINYQIKQEIKCSNCGTRVSAMFEVNSAGLCLYWSNHENCNNQKSH